MAQWRLPVVSGRGTPDLTITTGTPASVNMVNGAANTKGSWVVANTTTTDWHGFFVQPTTTGVAATNTARLMDIAIGPSGSEVTIVANLSVGHHSVPSPIFIPLFVPSGVDVSIRSQGVIASDSKSCAVWGIAGQGAAPPWIYRRCTTYGTDAANSRGTAINGGATANTEGAWTQIAAATTYDHRAVMVTIGLGRGGTAVTGCNASFRVGMGGAGSEVDLTGHAWTWIPTTSENYEPGRGHTWSPQELSIPAGSRLAASVLSSATNYQHLDISLHCFD